MRRSLKRLCDSFSQTKSSSWTLYDVSLPQNTSDATKTILLITFPVIPSYQVYLLVEMIAQAAGRCLIAGIDRSLWPIFLQIRQANFRKSVFPDSHLRIEVNVETCNSSTSSARGKVLLESEVVTEASILLGFVARELLLPDFEDPVLKAYLTKQKSAL